MKTQTCKLSVLVLAISLSSGLALATTPDTDSAQAAQDGVGTMTQDRAQLQSAEKPENAAENSGMNQNRARHQMRQHAGQDGRPELMTSEERAEFRDSMRSAETMEERHAIRDAMRATRMERAEAAGISLPDRGSMGMRGQRPERPSMTDKGSHSRAGH